MSSEINSENVNEIEILMIKISERIESYINSIKKQSIDEIMNGSIQRAKEILDLILPIQNAKNNLVNAQYELINLLKLKNVKPIRTEKSESDVLININQNKLKAAILKALIYLGGNAGSNEIYDYVKKDILKSNENENSFKQLIENENQFQKIMINECYLMLKDGLVIEDSLSKTWEILPAGIDFLSKFDLVSKSKTN